MHIDDKGQSDTGAREKRVIHGYCGSSTRRNGREREKREGEEEKEEKEEKKKTRIYVVCMHA